jgi:hypothetical protein
MFAFNLAVASVSSVFFAIYMRSAARTKERRHLAKRLFGWGTLVHSGAAVTVAVVLTFVSMKLNYEYYPGWSLAVAQGHFNSAMDEVRRRSISTDKNELPTDAQAAKVKPSTTAATPTDPTKMTDPANTTTVPKTAVNSLINERSARSYAKLDSEFGKLSSMVQAFDGRPPRGKKQGESAAADVVGQALIAAAKKPGEELAAEGGRQGEEGTGDAAAVTAKRGGEIAAGGKQIAAGDAIINQITVVCGMLRELPAGSNLVGRDCHPVYSGTQESDALPKAIVAFAKDLDTLRGDVNTLLEFRKHGDAYDSVLVQVAIAGFFALFVSLAFGAAVRFGRTAQLRNDIDQFDEDAISDLKQRADRYFKERGKSVDIEAWLTEPNHSIGLITPLEGVRYRGYRASLFDSFRPKLGETRVKETDASATPIDVGAAAQDSSPTPDESDTLPVEAPPTAPDAFAPADSEATVVVPMRRELGVG